MRRYNKLNISFPKLSVLLFISLLIIFGIGCSESEVSASNSSLTVNAGVDQVVSSNSLVTLIGRASLGSKSSQIVTYLWQQVSGTRINITGSNTHTISFTATDVAFNTLAVDLTFKLTVTDSDNFSVSDSVTVSVSPNIGSPISKNIITNTNRFYSPSNKRLTVDGVGVLHNDTNLTAHPLTVELASTTSNGLLTLSKTGNFEYQPETGFIGTDRFSYWAKTPSEQSALTEVTLNILASDDFYPMQLLEHTEQSSGLKHPGILLNSDEIRAIGSALLAGDATRIDYWNQMEASGRGKFEGTNWQPTNPLVGTEWDSPLKNAGAGTIRYALMWIMSRDEVAEQKAIGMLNEWAAMTAFTADDSDNLKHHRLVGGIWMGYLAYAAELLIHSNTNWPVDEQQAFKGMIKNLMLPIINGGYDERAGDFNGNWDLAATWSILSIAVLLDDRALFDENIERVKNGPTNARLSYYFLPTGQNAETTRDQLHAHMGMYFATLVAQIAWNQGIDLYEYDGRSLGKSIEYLAAYNLMNDNITTQLYPNPRHPGGSPIQNTTFYPDGDLRGDLDSIYEMIYFHYTHYRNTELPFTKMVLESKRPEGAWARGSNWGTNSYWNLDIELAGKNLPETADVSLIDTSITAYHKVAINSGMSHQHDNYQLHIAADGSVYVADFKTALNGKQKQLSADELETAGNNPLYYFYREGDSADINYQFALNNGNYKVRLHFKEHQYRAVGQRIMNIDIEGVVVENAFDIYASSGLQPLIIEYQVVVSDGYLDLAIRQVTGLPIISAIEVIVPAP